MFGVSDFLFARPSFLSGMARTLDLGANFDEYNISNSPELADSRALYNDWRAVGEALLAALALAHNEDASESPAGVVSRRV